MIDPTFLAALRRRERAEMVLVLVQLEQVIPGWWQDLEELADQLGTDRATLNRSIRHLEARGLIRRTSYSNKGGTWIWWAAKRAGDAPRPQDEPAWVARDTVRRLTERITVSGRWDWAKRHGIPKGTMTSWLYGHMTLLRHRWQIIASPLDIDVCGDAAHPPQTLRNRSNQS